MTPLAFQLGACSPTSAQIFATGLAAGDAATLRGPRCRTTATLECTFTFRPSARGDAWSATVLEPCFWRPDAPYWYEATLRRGSGETTSQPAAVAPFGLRDGALRLGGEPWRLIGVFSPPPAPHLWDDWQTAGLTPLVDGADLSVALLAEAVRQGLSLGVDLRGAVDPHGDLQCVGELAKTWPCLVAAATQDDAWLLTPVGPERLGESSPSGAGFEYANHPAAGPESLAAAAEEMAANHPGSVAAFFSLA